MENTNKRITKRERFQSLIELVELCEGREDEGFDFEGLTDFLSNEIRLLDAKKSSNSRKQTARQTENEHFKALIAEQLTEEGMTITMLRKTIPELEDLTPQRIAPMCKALVSEGIAYKDTHKGIAHFYKAQAVVEEEEG